MSEALLGRESIGALVCLNDRIAMGAYQALAERGLRVPEDVAVVSFDGSDLAGWLRPSVTSVSLPFADAGCGRGRRPHADQTPVSSGSRCRWCAADRQERGQTPATPST